MFDLDSKTFLVSRDVSFREKTFPFKQSVEPSEDIFLSSPTEYAVQPTQHTRESISGQSLPETESNTITSDEAAQLEGEVTETAVDGTDHVTSTDETTQEMEAEVENEANFELDSEMENGAHTPTEALVHEEVHEQPVISSESVVARKSNRGVKPPIWHKDYITSWTPCSLNHKSCSI